MHELVPLVVVVRAIKAKLVEKVQVETKKAHDLRCSPAASLLRLAHELSRRHSSCLLRNLSPMQCRDQHTEHCAEQRFSEVETT